MGLTSGFLARRGICLGDGSDVLRRFNVDVRVLGWISECIFGVFLFLILMLKGFPNSSCWDLALNRISARCFLRAAIVHRP